MMTSLLRLIDEKKVKTKADRETTPTNEADRKKYIVYSFDSFYSL